MFKSASLGERELILLSFHSISVFLLEWRVFIWIIFQAALLSPIVIEESASGVSQPFLLLYLEILNLLCLVTINILAFELDPASVSRGRDSSKDTDSRAKGTSQGSY